MRPARAEGPWHLGWKELFDISCHEIGLRDPMTGELHRADVLVGSGTPMTTVLELDTPRRFLGSNLRGGLAISAGTRMILTNSRICPLRKINGGSRRRIPKQSDLVLKAIHAAAGFRHGVPHPAPKTIAERRYALRTVKQRLHQASFREMVISAYRGKCAISGLPEPLLLDAAHIIDDRDERYGQPIVGNGIPLSKIHHAAFDAHLICIDADSRIHVSEKLLSLRDGPTLEALRQFYGEKLTPPQREHDKPDRDRLAKRFEVFKSAA